MTKPYTVAGLEPVNLNVAQVARRFGCSTDAIYDMIARGDLKAFRVGARLWRVKLEEVERWESIGDRLKSTDTDLDTSKDKPSPSGEERPVGTAKGLGLPPPRPKPKRSSARSSPAAG